MPSMQIIMHPISKNECISLNVCGVARVLIQYLLGDQRQDNKEWMKF